MRVDPVLWAAVLAAGEGKRMGYVKMLRPIAGKAMLLWTLEAVVAGGVHESSLVVVVGYKGEEVADLVSSAFPKATIAANPDYRREMFSSIKVAAECAPPATPLLLALGDQPAVNPKTIERLISEAACEKVVQPVYEGKAHHPLILPPHIVDAVKSSPVYGTLRELLPPLSERHLVAVDDQGVALDVDTEEDLKRAESILAARARP
ncbi:nucleotidyltransferase family protein [Acetomicrobium sp. S15 = DSM 107314]|jgi:molybdenum cofactor cytidylyltransferase|uniref:nucleotidyltransferase family protein n=1 Tax=Acetomicrobium sp. S15 = DSM 107314 TaxID=2529858 RepID=UPI0018E10FA0|nr:nucleotidyltransferase family protein [Acetomicrobium sp. S15 = DSM 107314]